MNYLSPVEGLGMTLGASQEGEREAPLGKVLKLGAAPLPWAMRRIFTEPKKETLSACYVA